MGVYLNHGNSGFKEVKNSSAYSRKMKEQSRMWRFLNKGLPHRQEDRFIYGGQRLWEHI